MLIVAHKSSTFLIHRFIIEIQIFGKSTGNALIPFQPLRNKNNYNAINMGLHYEDYMYKKYMSMLINVNLLSDRISLFNHTVDFLTMEA